MNLALMRLLDAQFTRTPFYGYRRITVYLQDREQPVNAKRVARSMRQMGLLAVYPRPRTSLPNQQHLKYPYLLRGLDIQRPNQVWSADITYVPLPRGFVYLVAIIDWYSRFVLAWQLSIRWTAPFVWRRYTRPCTMADRRSLTPTRARSSQRMPSSRR
ncbi:MAG: IS3 family transposase [Anaerolineae bacterium]|nr:IS3 family transposase [Anaerolineae bacterium]